MENKSTKELTTVTVKVKTVKTDKTTFKSYKVNVDGKGVDLRFRKDSASIGELKDGIYKMTVTGFEESTSSFYPRYYATFVAMAE